MLLRPGKIRGGAQFKGTVVPRNGTLVPLPKGHFERIKEGLIYSNA